MNLLEPDERAAIRAFLQRSEVRLSTVHRVATALLSGAGLMVLLKLPKGDNDETLCRRLAERGIEAQPLSTHYAGNARQPGLLLGFAGFTDQQLRQGAATLLSCLAERKK